MTNESQLSKEIVRDPNTNQIVGIRELGHVLTDEQLRALAQRYAQAGANAAAPVASAQVAQDVADQMTIILQRERDVALALGTATGFLHGATLAFGIRDGVTTLEEYEQAMVDNRARLDACTKALP